MTKMTVRFVVLRLLYGCPENFPLRIQALQGLPKFFDYPYYLSLSGMGKATNLKFCTHICRIDWNKSPLKIWAKVCMIFGRTQGLSKIFSPYIGRIARSSSR